MYYVVYSVVLIGSLLSFLKTPNTLKKILFLISLFSMTALLCLRYGQGLDYFGYMSEYNAMPKIFDIRGLYAIRQQYHSDYGYLLLASVFRSVFLPFEAFVFFLSLYMMWCLYKGISMYSENKVFSLLMFFPTAYFTYYFSALRQGFCIATFIGIILPSLLKKEYFRYVLLVIVCCFFHKSSMVLLILPFLSCLKKEISFWQANILGFVGSFTYDFLYNLSIRLNFLDAYNFKSISLISFFERLMMLIIVYVLYYCSNKEKRIVVFLNIYVLGYILYLVLIQNELVSSRLVIIFKCVDFVLIPNLIFYARQKLIKKNLYFPIIVVVILTNMVMFVKNMHAVANVFGYTDGYRYVSIFDKR